MLCFIYFPFFKLQNTYWDPCYSWPRSSKNKATKVYTDVQKPFPMSHRGIWTTPLHIKKQRHYFANKGPSSQGYSFSSSHVWMWELDYTESWVPKNRCFWTVVLEKTLESPLDCKEIQPVHPKGDQSWVFIGRTDAEAEMPILWPPDAKSWLVGKDPDAGKDWGQEEKGMTEDEMVGWHHRLNGHGFGWTPGAGDGQGGLACCGSWSRKELDTTEHLNWTDYPRIYNTFKLIYIYFQMMMFPFMNRTEFFVFFFNMIFNRKLKLSYNSWF